MQGSLYVLFKDAAEDLIATYQGRQTEQYPVTNPPSPVLILLSGIVDGFGAVLSPAVIQDPLPALIVSELTDKAGPVHECMNTQYTIPAPPALTQVSISPGDRILMHVVLGIHPAGTTDDQRSILYRSDGKNYALELHLVLFLERMQ